MDTDGVVIDKANEPKVGKGVALKMYRDMVTGEIREVPLVNSS